MSQLKRAISLAQSGQTEKAVAILRQLTEQNPDDMYAWLWLADCTTDTDEARQAAKQVLKIRPTNERAHVILESLGEEPELPPTSSRQPKRKHDQPRAKARRNQKLIFSGFGLSVFVFLLAFILLINPEGQAVFNLGETDSANASEEKTSQKNSSADKAKDSDENPIEIEDWDDVDPETLTIQWFEGIITGEQEADISWSCGDEPSGLQKTLEPFAERLLEYGVRQSLRLIQLDAVFSTVEIIDGTAEYEVDGKIIVEILGQRIESPEFSTIIRFVSDGSQWAICEVTN